MIALALAVRRCRSAAAARRPRRDPGFAGLGARSRCTRRTARRAAVVLLSGEGGLRATGARSPRARARGALVARARPARLDLGVAAGARCAYPAGDLESLAQRVEKALGLQEYRRPFLVGHARGSLRRVGRARAGTGGTFAARAARALPGRPLRVRLCAGAGPAPRATAAGDLPGRRRARRAPARGRRGPGGPRLPGERRGASRRRARVRVTVLPGSGHALAPRRCGRDVAAIAIEACSRAVHAVASAQSGAGRPASRRRRWRTCRSSRSPAAKPGRGSPCCSPGDGGWVGLDKELSRALSDARRRGGRARLASLLLAAAHARGDGRGRRARVRALPRRMGAARAHPPRLLARRRHRAVHRHAAPARPARRARGSSRCSGPAPSPSSRST